MAGNICSNKELCSPVNHLRSLFRFNHLRRFLPRLSLAFRFSHSRSASSPVTLWIRCSVPFRPLSDPQETTEQATSEIKEQREKMKLINSMLHFFFSFVFVRLSSGFFPISETHLAADRSVPSRSSFTKDPIGSTTNHINNPTNDRRHCEAAKEVYR